MLNVGLPLIVEGVTPADVTQLDWRPPGFGDEDVARLMVALDDERTRAGEPTRDGLVHAVRPQLVGVRPAGEVIPGLAGDRRLLHAGPPIEMGPDVRPGPRSAARRRPVRGMGGYPGGCRPTCWTAVRSGWTPCHHHGAVGPMAGVISPSMPVLVIGDQAAEGDRRAFSTLNEGLGKVLRFGAYDAEVLTRLAWLRDVAGPTLHAAVQLTGRWMTSALFGQALSMGDEGHNRNVAATALLTRRLAAALAEQPGGADLLRFLAGNDHFALNLSMAAAKLSLDAAVGVEDSSVVTAMARNGVEFGLRVAGTGERWFTAPGRPGRRAVLSRLRPRGRKSRSRRLGHHRDPRTGRLRHGRRAGDHPVRRRHPRRRAPGDPLDASDHGGAAPGLPAAPAELHRHTIGHRCAAGGGDRRAAGDQHWHRSSRGRASARSAPAWSHAPAEVFLSGGPRALAQAEAAAMIGRTAAARLCDRRQRPRPGRGAGVLTRQSERAREFAAVLVGDSSPTAGRVVVTHGNGPQVGFIFRRGELVADAASAEGLPDLPLWLAVADSQGGIGHLLALAMDSELWAHDRPERAAAVLTHVEVDGRTTRPSPPRPSPSVACSTKRRPVRHASRDGWTVAETSPGRWRRVVPSPEPVSIVELEPIGQLVAAGALVIAAGGGGIPIVRSGDGWIPLDAVVDKDRAAALLAAGLGASHLVHRDRVDEVAIGYGTARQQPLRRVDAD